ncbi:hypothetical protein KW17_05120 [Listeria monocytogenes]|nr:hypothetical protein [Listeria monocytogenes]
MKIDVRELRELVNEHMTALTKEHETLKDAMTATTTFTTETQEFFKGKTADASRAYLQEAYLPVQQKTLEVNELMTKTLDAYIADAEAQFGANGIVDIPAIEMEYRRNLNQLTDQERQEYQELNNLIQEANEFISFPTINLSLLEELQHDALAVINKIHMKLEDFDTKWNAEFNKVETLQTELDHMLAQVGNNTITPTSYQAGMIKFMNAEQQALYDKLPPEFKDAITSGFATIEDFQATDDGFIICMVPLSIMLNAGDVANATDYNDQFLFCIKNEKGDFVFSTCKLRTGGDNGESSSVAVSFVSISAKEILNIFNKNPNMSQIDNSIYAGSDYSMYQQPVADKALLNYFRNPDSKASYLLADLYVQKILNASSTEVESGYSVTNVNGGQELVDSDYKKYLMESEYKALLKNPSYNKQSGTISISDINNLTEDEYNAILLTHSANIDSYSFAAEVKFHADYADSSVRYIRDSAIKSDMGIGESANNGRYINIPFLYDLNEERYKTKDGDLYIEQLQKHAKS